MDEFAEIEAWIETLDFSHWWEEWSSEQWPDEDEMHLQWVAARQSADFEAQRVRVLSNVQRQEEYNPLNDAECHGIERIRDRVTRRANEWICVGELGTCVADDIELMARAARVGVCDFWLDKLRSEYDSGRFPHNRL